MEPKTTVVSRIDSKRLQICSFHWTTPTPKWPRQRLPSNQYFKKFNFSTSLMLKCFPWNVISKNFSNLRIWSRSTTFVSHRVVGFPAEAEMILNRWLIFDDTQFSASSSFRTDEIYSPSIINLAKNVSYATLYNILDLTRILVFLFWFKFFGCKISPEFLQLANNLLITHHSFC